MIEINLLPDIKREYLRSQRVKHFFMLGSLVASGAAVALVVFVWLFTVSQNVHLGNLQKDIDAGLSELQSIEDLDKVVTVQNQLSAIEPLNDAKPEAALLFDYLTLLTPNDVDLGIVEVVYTDSPTAEISGVGKGFKAINRFVDAIKNATYTHRDSEEPVYAFSDVVLASSGASADQDDVAFRIDLVFDQAIFDNNLESLRLSVPSITSSQSEVQRPKSLFEPDAQQQVDESGGQ